MSEFPTAAITHFDALGTREISEKLNLRVVRYSPAITQGVATITLPTDCSDIICVVYRGLPIYPMKPQNYMQAGMPFYNSTSRPISYLFNKLTTVRTIKFYPTPNESLASGNVDTGVATSCIITYRGYCSDANPVPAWLGTRLLQYFTGYNLYMMEGKTQNLKFASYLKKRYAIRSQNFMSQLSGMYFGPRQLVVQGLSLVVSNWRRRNLPVLPPNFGRPSEGSLIKY